MLENDGYPKPWPLFWSASVLAVGYLVAALAKQWRAWARGLPVSPTPHAPRGRVVRIWLAEVVAQRQLLQLSRLRWAAHLAVFLGFVGLALLSGVQVLLHFAGGLGFDGGPAAWLRGDGRVALKAWGNGAGLILLVGLLLALARRLVRREGSAARTGESGTPLVIFLLVLTLSGFLLEALRQAAGASPTAASALRPWLSALWTVHGLGGVALVAWLPRGSLLHAVLAPLVIALNARAEHARKDLYWPRTKDSRASGSRPA